MNYRRIIITGFMGTGKSAAGRLLASKLKWLHFDTDALAETTEGLTVSEIFQKKGEEHFRKLERRCLEGLVSMSELVISTGGGTLIEPENLALASKDAAVVCLTATEQEIRKRLGKDKSRPLLKAGFDSVFELLKKREEAYKKMGLQVDTTGKSPQEVADEIASGLGLNEGTA